MRGTQFECVYVRDLFSITFQWVKFGLTMKTTVSATILMILVVHECGALQNFGHHGQPQQYSSFQSQQNIGLQSQAQHSYVSSYQQLQGAQPHHSQQQSPNGAASEPISNAGHFGTNTPRDSVWQTPDPKSSESTTAGRTPLMNPANYPAVITPQKMRTTRKPSSGHEAASSVANKKQTMQRNPQRKESIPSTTVASADKVVFYPPGGNKEGSTFNALDTKDTDSGPDSAMNINNGLRQFALNMLLDMIDSTPTKNVVLSPYSIWAVMLVIYEGAEGRTAEQIASTLRLSGKKSKVRKNYMHLESALQKANNESRSDFVSGNGIFYDKMRPPLPDFQRFALSAYQCHLQDVDFTKTQLAVKTINDWVSQVTHNRIKMLVSAEDVMRPELIITNALFFKGQWEIPFNLTATYNDKFYNEQKQQIATVRMMYQKGKYLYSFINEIGAHVLDMPYVDEKFRMLVVLPKPSSTVAEVLRSMRQFPVDQCYERLVREQEMFAEDEVHVYLPRFTFGNRMELRPNLERLGIKDVFDASRANMSLMSPLNLFLGKVFHVSEIEVNEEGTIASGATGAGFVNKMGPPKFLANRPFAYFIVENSQKTVIFAGKVADPTKKS